MKSNVKTIILLLALLILLPACTMGGTPEVPGAEIPSTGEMALQTPTNSPGIVPPTYTNTPIPPTPTDTPLPPTVTHTPAPTSLNTHGPYLMFRAHNGIWITNPDGTFPTRLSDVEITSAVDLRLNISPTGDRLALVISNDQGLDLVLVQIPGGEAETITHLIDSPPSGALYDPTSANSFATYAIRDFNGIAWQPGGGRLLAFVGATNGPTADLYLYDTQTGEITQLTDGPAQAVLPVWSPDGQYILHYGVSWVPPFGGAIVGPNRLDGVWAVRVSDGTVISLPRPSGSLPNFVGWQDDSHYITYDPGDCYSENLRAVDIATGEATPIMENSFWHNIAQSPQNGALLFSSVAGCPSSLGDGIFLLLPGQTTATRLYDVKAWEISWMPESRVFNAYPEGLFTSDGQTRYEPPVYEASYEPAVSMAGYQAWSVSQNQVRHVMVRVPGGEWHEIFTGSIADLIWDPVDGSTLLIILEDGSIQAASYPDFSPRLISSLGAGVMQVIWSP